MSDPITWKPPGPIRFQFVHELQGRVSDADIAQRSLKLKTDCSVAMYKIDQALQPHGRRTRLEHRSVGMFIDDELVPIEYRSGGRVISVQ